MIFKHNGNLSRYTVKGHKASPICEEDTFFVQLKHGRKTIYLGTQRFLPMLHRSRKVQKVFNGSTEEEKLQNF